MSKYIIQKNTEAGLIKVNELVGDDWDANTAFTDAMNSDDGTDAVYQLSEILPSGVNQFIKAMRPSEWRQKLADMKTDSPNENTP